MTQQEKLDILKQAGVLLTGHFKLTSGRHSDRYMQCAHVFEDTACSELFCKDIAEHFKDMKVDLVAGPAVGGIIIAYEVARQLGARNIFAEREEGKMTLRRGFTVKEGERVLVVEDTVTTGGSVREVIELIRAMKGVPVGVGSVVDRSNGKVDFGIPFYAAVSMDIPSYDEADCPLCKAGSVAIKPGSRHLSGK